MIKKLLTITLSLMMIFTSFVPVFAEGEEVNIVGPVSYTHLDVYKRQVLNGLPRDLAYKLASQTVLGSAKMVKEMQLHPGILKDQVCSPGGITTVSYTHLDVYKRQV